MAKRPTSRPTGSGGPAAPAQPRPRRARAAAVPKHQPEPTTEDIRRRAYERYLERGGRHGQHFDDWVEAEKELRGKK
jgi:hypothetical protein